jgi:hypothetical protein
VTGRRRCADQVDQGEWDGELLAGCVLDRHMVSMGRVVRNNGVEEKAGSSARYSLSAGPAAYNSRFELLPWNSSTCRFAWLEGVFRKGKSLDGGIALVELRMYCP